MGNEAEYVYLVTQRIAESPCEEVFVYAVLGLLLGAVAFFAGLTLAVLLIKRYERKIRNGREFSRKETRSERNLHRS